MHVNEAIVLARSGALPPQTMIFREWGAICELVERRAARIELTQGYTKARQAAASQKPD
ncbi:hypothetical protein [Microcoleus sp. herbarium12]|uniref:hypothetical protein n=1 Tax=Microcoleus sp. herbarium12 TaxID=3055437 RepID=UPI002FCF8655